MSCLFLCSLDGLGRDHFRSESVDADVDYCFVLENGIRRIDKHAQGSNRFSGKALLQVSNNIWTANSLQCAKRITRMALSPLLGRKPLKSRELFQQTWTTPKPDNNGNVK